MGSGGRESSARRGSKMNANIRAMSKKAKSNPDHKKSYVAGGDDNVTGWLKKRGQAGVWQKRFFVLHGRYLSFLKKEPKSADDFATGVVGSIDLWSVQSVNVEGADILIFLTKTAQGRGEGKRGTLMRAMSMAMGQELVLRADNADKAQRWVQAMFAGGLEGRARRAFDAEGSAITQIVPEVRDALQVDSSDSTTLRETDIAIRAVKVKSDGKTVFESKRLLGNSRFAVGNVPLDSAVVNVQLSRAGKDAGKALVSLPVAKYFNKEQNTYTVILADANLSLDAVRVVLERDPIQAAWHSIENQLGPQASVGALGGAFILAVAVLSVALGPVLGVIGALVASAGAIGGVFAVHKDAAVLTGVELVPMHEARRQLKLLKLVDASRASSKRASKKRTSTKRQESVMTDLGEDDDDAGDVADDQINESAELTKAEIKLCAELRGLVSDMLETKDARSLKIIKKYVDHDFRLVRYLRARGLNLKKAEKLLRKSLSWNVDYDAENIHDNYTPPDWVLEYAGTPMILEMIRNKENRLPWYFRDKEGHLGVYVRSGVLNMRKVYKKLGNNGEAFFRLGVWLFQMVQDDLDQIYEESGHTVPSQITAVIDLKDFSLSNQIPINDALALARKYIPKILDAHPEVLYRVVVINAPWLFHNVWSLFKPFLPKRVLFKISIMSSNKSAYEKKIAEHFDPNNIPTIYGGNYDDTEGMRIAPCGPFRPDKGLPLLALK